MCKTGKIHGDVFQRSFLEYMACQYECQKMTCEEPFSCPACTPKMLAVSVDGNRKQYRFRQSQRIDEPLFKGPFIMEDSAVTDFTPGKGTCGTSQWSAARETARKASRLDEEGLEVAVCRHGVLLKALNMFRGEIFAYPLFLQTQFQATNVHFYCTDIACKYWPYLEKVAKTMPELRPLLSMQPFLSVMHAKAHSTNGRNLEGAGSTAGEEVEMVNSFLSRCAITTKYMTKSDMKSYGNLGENLENTSVSATSLLQQTIKMLEGETQKMKDTCEELGKSNNGINTYVVFVLKLCFLLFTQDNTSGDNQSLQMSIEQLFLGLCQKKACLYRQTDSNKIRQLRRKRLREEKTKLLAAIRQYNTGQPPEGEIQEEEVERRLSAEQQTTDSLIWPWKIGVHFGQKKVFDAYMGKRRLVEERAIIVREMRQHCLYLRSQADKIRMQMQHVSCGGHSGKFHDTIPKYYLPSTVKLADVDTHIQHLSSAYSLAIGPNAPQWPDDSVENHDQDSDISDDSEEDPDEDITHTLPPP
ncbi:hypothetical protein F7725_009438 [Dissostichus mawsoni]|uniref:Uncharacterized protein n=1 Tax=Dissostichus mawsoni TaxID=36200 RepID=A0A7J5XKZ7_DISMA|nr:hypothetical protein F7725_009438 [Dissostichus mawsoni]